MQELTIRNPEELTELATAVIKTLDELPHEEHTVVLALHGELGAGKTSFVQALARHLGVTEAVTSPTFVIMKRYDAHDPTFKTLVHIDAYRVENIDEMRVIGLADLFSQKDTIICIEWAERIATMLPEHTLHISFGIEGDARTVTIST